MRQRIEGILQPDGRLAQIMPRYEFRKHQLGMALDAADALQNKSIFLAEAGTGTGKSLAYLLPAALWGRQVIVSTGTKNLQEQLIHSDIPLVNRLIDRSINAVVMKGRSNYLCRFRWNNIRFQPSMFGDMDSAAFEKLAEWVSSSSSGDRDEIKFLPENSPIWPEINARHGLCQSSRCPFFSECFLMKLKIKAQYADLLVVNHHLFFADRMLRQRNYTPILPDADAVIFDEAHQLEDTASLFLGASIGFADMTDLLHLATFSLKHEPDKKKSGRNEPSVLKELHTAAVQFFFQFGKGDGRYALRDHFGQGFSETAAELERTLENLRMSVLTDARIELPQKGDITMRIDELKQTIQLIQSHSEPDLVYWVEISAAGSTLHATPVEIKSDFLRLTGESGIPLIFTSATLSVNGDFGYVSSRLGISDYISKTYPSPFDYGDQALMYLPTHLPLQKDPAYFEKMADEIAEIVDFSRGRAFILTTSRYSMNTLAAMLRGRLPFRTFVQGDAPRQRLVEMFKAETDSVLIATNSFWQGVDVPGESLSCVILIKLPFDWPEDPITEARIEWIRRNNGNPFRDYQLPVAVMSLKQGAGRLLRSQSDRGIVAVLDHRILTKNYGSVFLKSLPPFRQTNSIEDVGAFFDDA